LNSDDVYYNTRLEELADVLESDDSIHAAFSHMEIIDGDGNLIRFKKGAEENWLNHNPETSFKGMDNMLLDLLAGNFLVSTSNLFCRKSVFKTVGYFSNLRYTHDYEFFLRLCYKHKVHLRKKVLLKYRVHELSTISENRAVENFETALTLTKFLLQSDFEEIFLPENDFYVKMTKFFNSINTYKADRVMMVLLIFSLKFQKSIDDVFSELTDNPNNPFRKQCVEYTEPVEQMRQYLEEVEGAREQLAAELRRTRDLLEQVSGKRDHFVDEINAIRNVRAYFFFKAAQRCSMPFCRVFRFFR